MEQQAHIYAVYNKDGELTKLVEAYSLKAVKAHLLNGVTIERASALTVSRATVKTEKAD